MRRFVGLAVLLFFSIPFGLSVTGCGHKAAPVQYCNSGDSGPVVGQVAQIVLAPSLATVGESLNYGQIGQALSASAVDCKGNAVSVSKYVYASTSSFTNSSAGTVFADINPNTGSVCAGLWNRNTGGGIQDYTTCTAPTSQTNYVPTVVTPGGSPYTYTANSAGTLTVGGGTVSSIVVTPSGGQAATQKYTSGIFTVGIGDAVTITYSSVPTVEFFAPNALSPVAVGSLSTATYTAPSSGTISVPTLNGVVAFIYVTHNGVPTLQPAASTSFAVSAGDVVTFADYSTPSVSFTPTGGSSVAVTLTPSTVLAFNYSSTSGGTFALGGGTVQYLFLTHNGTTSLQSSNSGLFALAAGDSASIVYSALPAIGFNPYGAVAYITATAAGAASNAIPVYVHPTATTIVLGSASNSCVAGQSIGTDCCPNITTGTTATAPVYNGDGTSCLSQNKTGQLVARIYQNGTTTPANNITCQVGHLTYGTQNASTVVAIDQNGIATANQPGSTEITATIAQSSTATNAGFFSTCPPASIALTAQGYPATTNSVNVSLNNVQPLTATVLDTQGATITGLTLEYNSTQPQLIPGGSGSITPIFPGSATITAACQPGTCNPSGFSQIGVLGNGKPITSNGITINTAGSSGTVIYAGSTTTATSAGSQYLFVQDFTTTNAGALVKLPYVPNSIAITLSGSSIYMGSAGGLMTFSTASNSVTSTNQSIAGQVLSVSPDSSTLVVTDPSRNTVSLVSTSSNAVTTSYGGTGTHAAWSPDTQTVYITTTTGAILSHSVFTDWQTSSATNSQIYSDVAVTVPSVGAFFAGPLSTDGLSYCSSTTSITNGNPPTAVNSFLPLAAEVLTSAPVIGRIAATNNGLHMLEANVPQTGNGAASFVDLDVAIPVQACPATIPRTYFGAAANTTPLGVTATSITGVLPTNNSILAFVTYNGTSGLLPYYLVPTTGIGTLGYLKLQNGATAPLAGVLSTDNSTLYVGTAGDNAVHQIGITYPTVGAPTVVDTATPLTPNLPSASGTGTVPANLLVQYPKKSTT